MDEHKIDLMTGFGLEFFLFKRKLLPVFQVLI